MTDIVSMLRRMLQSVEPAVDVASMGTCESGLRDYFYSQSGKCTVWYLFLRRGVCVVRALSTLYNVFQVLRVVPL